MNPHAREVLEKGFTILPGLIGREQVAEINQAIDRSWEGAFPGLQATWGGEPPAILTSEFKQRPCVKMLCLHAHAEPLRRALLHPTLQRILAEVFDGESPMLFQSLTFTKGSEQPAHQDTAYVIVDQPLKLAACWLALEDITPSSGPLIYYEGSHRMRNEYLHAGKSHEEHYRWLHWLTEECERRGYPKREFLAKAGDVLIWHAELVHGGATISDPKSTRRSVAAHYCPSSCRPDYFRHGPKTVRPFEGASWTTSFY